VFDFEEGQTFLQFLKDNPPTLAGEDFFKQDCQFNGIDVGVIVVSLNNLNE